MKKTVCLVSAALLAMSANAASITKIDKDIVNATVTVEGEGLKPNETAGLWITYPNVLSLTDGRQSGTLAYAGEVTADSDGKFVQEVLMPTSTNKQIINFDVRVVAQDGSQDKTVLKYIDNDGLEQNLLDIKGATDKDEMYNIFSTTASALDIELIAPWQNLNDKDAVLLGAYNVRSTFESFSDVQNELNYRILHQAMREAQTADDFHMLMETYKSLLDNSVFDTTYTSMPAAVSDDYRTRFFDNRGKLDGTKKSFKKTFKESVLLSYIAKLDRNAPLVSVLSDYADILIEADSTMTGVMAAYNADSSKQITVCNALLNARASTISLVNTTIKNAINDDGGSSSASSSSGSKRSGKGSSMSVDSGFVPGKITEAPSADFADLAKEHFAYNAVSYLTSNNIVNGYYEGDEKLFKPQNEISREEFLKLVYTAFDFSADSAEHSFADVQKDSWYEKFVASAARDGIVNGMSDTAFGTGRQITREDMAVMIYRALQKKGISLGGESEVVFADSEGIADYAADAVEILRKAGIVSGDEAGRFNPKSNATRGEAAKILYEIVIRMGR